jgi:Heterokaryon incompatibility protein Het-C
MRSFWFTISLIVLIFAFLPSAHAFGAGEIPGYAFLKGQVKH